VIVSKKKMVICCRRYRLVAFGWQVDNVGYIGRYEERVISAHLLA
jgi:hypothetical protein